MNPLDKLEATSVHILRESYREFKSLVMLWSIGKDSTVLLWLARKAFFGHVPFPLMHVDTHFKIPEMIAYRDRLALELHLDLIVGENKPALDAKQTFPDGKLSRMACCRSLKSEALKHTLSGEWPRLRMDHDAGRLVEEKHPEPFTGVIVGARADEEGSRSKERYFSARDQQHEWDVGATIYLERAERDSARQTMREQFLRDNLPDDLWGNLRTDNIDCRMPQVLLRWPLVKSTILDVIPR